MNVMKAGLLMAIAALMAAALAACSPGAAAGLGETGETVTVQGVVQSIDLDPMAADGPGEVMLTTEEHGEVLVLVASCFGECAPEATDRLFEMQPGEQWQATGEVQEDGVLSIYVEGEHSLTPLD